MLRKKAQHEKHESPFHIPLMFLDPPVYINLSPESLDFVFIILFVLET